MDLKKLRTQIDFLDSRIVELLNKRAKVTEDIGRVKISQGKSIYSPEREQAVLSRIIRLNRGPLTEGGLQAIYREVMSSSLALEKPLKIAYLGPEASFTHLASLRKFGSQVGYVACKSITEVFLEVERGACDYGVVPVENSIEGAVTHTLDMFMDSDLKICAQTVLDVSHNLMGRCALKDIKRVYSNPQVFGQCRMWLQEHLPQAELVDAASTTSAAKTAVREKGSAAIASSLAAQVYKLKILAADIEDSPHNITRFFVIGLHPTRSTGKDRTSIMFSIKDKVGALHEMLLPFAKYKINLTRIESRPSKKKAWEYYFFVDMQGHCAEPRVKKALAELEDKCKMLKVLGSYPVGD